MRVALLSLGVVVLAALVVLSMRDGSEARAVLSKQLPRAPGAHAEREPTVLVPPVEGREDTGAEPTPELGGGAPPTIGAARKDRGAPARRPPTAVLYRHAEHDELFPGERWVLPEGLTDSGVAFADDEASAADVPAGVLLTLYADAGGNGARVTLGPGRHNLAPLAFNDVASSARVSRAGAPSVDLPSGKSASVELYENLPRTESDAGRLWTLPLAEARTTELFSARDGFFHDNAPSAIWVPAEMEVTLFDEPDGRGFAFVLGPGFHELDRTRFDERVSSVRVRRTRED